PYAKPPGRMTAATSSSEACSCHRTTGSAPASSSAWTVSRSQLLPGKTTTPIRTGISVVPRPDTHGRRCGCDRLDRVGLDERVREQLPGETLDDRPGFRLVRRVHGQLRSPADPDGTDALDPEVAEAALDRPALRVEDPGLRRDIDREPEAGHEAMTSSWR